MSATLCDDLERLLETGFAELLRTGTFEEDFGEDVLDCLEEESPFPRGKAVFDDGSPLSDEDECREDGYEVICAQEINTIPQQPEQTAKPQLRLSEGASYVVGRAGKLLGSLFR